MDLYLYGFGTRGTANSNAGGLGRSEIVEGDNTEADIADGFANLLFMNACNF